MPQRRRYLTQGVGVAIATLVVATVPTVAVDATEPATDTPAVVFYTPLDKQTAPIAAGGSLHLMLGAQPTVVSVQPQYSTDKGVTWKSIGTPLRRGTGSNVFDTTWKTPGTLGASVQLRATGYDANGDPVPGDSLPQTVALSANAGTTFDFIRPRTEGDRVRPLGVFKRADGRLFARASGQTTGAKPTADDPASDPDVRATLPTTTLPDPTGTFDAAKGIFREPVDLSAHPGLTLPGSAVIRVSDGTSSEAIESPLYLQAVSAVSSEAARLASGSNVLTARVTDQYNQPVVGAPVRLTGYAAGSPSPVAPPLAVTDGAGEVSFAGYSTGFYVAYADLNLDGRRGPREPGFEWVIGTVSYAAPGRALYHNNTRTRGAAGTVGDSLRGTRAAAARGYRWIDQDGRLSFTSRADLRSGARRVTQPAHLTWVNAHGAPFNPRWLKKGRFETRAWAGIRKHRGLRNVDMTFRQNAAYGLSVEWEVKDIKPFTSTAALDAAFANLAAAARRYYGPGWTSRVEVKMLSNLSGGQAFALRVLRVAHAHGFTTLLLSRGRATGLQIPASAQQYVTFVRGAKGGLYPSGTSRPGFPTPKEPPFA